MVGGEILMLGAGRGEFTRTPGDGLQAPGSAGSQQHGGYRATVRLSTRAWAQECPEHGLRADSLLETTGKTQQISQTPSGGSQLTKLS